jgi:hypothetical protein
MPSLPRISIARLMAFIALFAIELALLQGLLFIVLLPPITMAFVSLNLGLFYILRWLPRSMEARIFGMLSGGMISVFILVGYYLGSRVKGPPLGIAGAAISDFLSNLAASRSDPSAPATTVLRFAARSVPSVEILLLDLLGLAMIWAGAWIHSKRPDAAIPPAAIGPESPSALDDRAVTPL